MGAIYTGIVSAEGYVFATNDIFGASQEDCAILRVNSLCGALIVTARGDLLSRVADVLRRCVGGREGNADGLSEGTAETISRAFLEDTRKAPDWKRRPMPFLLLLVGYGGPGPRSLRHVYVRHRVTGVKEVGGAREYETSFDIMPPAPASHLHYGHSELARYLSAGLAASDLGHDSVMILSHYSVTETQGMDGSISAGFRMAALSEKDGFSWIGEGRIRDLSARAAGLDRKVTQDLFRRFVSGPDRP